MRRLLALLLLPACGYDVIGTWQIEAVSVDGVVMEDAGFIDVRTDGDVSSGLPHAVLLRYWWDPQAAAWTPDPTPFIQTASFDVYNFQDEPGAVDMNLDFPTGPATVERAVFTPDLPRAGRWELSDPDWPHGALQIDLVR